MGRLSELSAAEALPSESADRRWGAVSVTGRRRKRLLYFLNAFDRGGAELGLVFLAKNGLFDPFDTRIVSICRGSGEPANELTALGFGPTAFFPDRQMKTVHLAGALPRLLTLLRRECPDVLILSLPQANIVGRIAARIAGVPTVISFEHSTRLARRAYEHLYLASSWAVDILLADCTATADAAMRRRYLDHRIPRVVLPLCAFSAEAPKRPTRSAPVGQHARIAAVGHLAPVKNHRSLLDAIGLLGQQGLVVEAEIFGEGPLRAELGARAKVRGISHLVRFRGFVPNWWEHTDANLFVLTSLREGLCMAALESMWAGIPVIAPRIGGLVDYGSEANMVAVADLKPATIAQAIARALTEPDRMAAIARRAACDTRARFAPTTVRERIAEIARRLDQQADQREA
jgi:glycosyltransferase involved in cell wall biosynthesis